MTPVLWSGQSSSLVCTFCTFSLCTALLTLLFQTMAALSRLASSKEKAFRKAASAYLRPSSQAVLAVPQQVRLSGLPMHPRSPSLGQLTLPGFSLKVGSMSSSLGSLRGPFLLARSVDATSALRGDHNEEDEAFSEGSGKSVGSLASYTSDGEGTALNPKPSSSNGRGRPRDRGAVGGKTPKPQNPSEGDQARGASPSESPSPSPSPSPAGRGRREGGGASDQVQCILAVFALSRDPIAEVAHMARLILRQLGIEPVLLKSLLRPRGKSQQQVNPQSTGEARRTTSESSHHPLLSSPAAVLSVPPTHAVAGLTRSTSWVASPGGA